MVAAGKTSKETNMTKKSALKPRIRIPRNIKKGDVFEVKTLITHAMESGQRVDKKTKKK